MLGVLFTLAKVTVREAPSQGLVKAMSAAWQSHEVQTALQAVSDGSNAPSKSAPVKASKDKVKLIGIAWAEVTMELDLAVIESVSTRFETWTPSWPQAPPGTPPRAA